MGGYGLDVVWSLFDVDIIINYTHTNTVHVWAILLRNIIRTFAYNNVAGAKNQIYNCVHLEEIIILRSEIYYLSFCIMLYHW